MIDPNLERRYVECSELVDAWKLFLELVNRATKPPKTTNSQLEQQFLNAKARIAILHDSFMDSLKHDKQVGANMLEIVNRAITLRLLAKFSEPEAKKMEQEWHEVFMLLNGTVSDLNEERAQLANVNELSHNMGKVQEKIWVYSRNFLVSIWMKIIVVTALIIFIIWGGPAMGLYDWNSLRKAKMIKPVVKTYLNVMREFVGVNMPYYDLDIPVDRLIVQPVANVSAEDRTAKSPQDPTIPNLLPGMKLFAPEDPKDLDAEKAILLGAQDYRYVRYNADGDRAHSYAAILWFQNTKDADNFMGYYRKYASQMPDTYSVNQKVNVMIILFSTDKSFLDETRTKRVGLLKP